MQQGVLMMQRPEQWEAAVEVFTELIAKAPMFAEAYNKRAVSGLRVMGRGSARRPVLPAMASPRWRVET